MSECKYCGEDSTQLAIMAVMVDLGCKVSPRPSECPQSPDGEHHFEALKPKEEK